MLGMFQMALATSNLNMGLIIKISSLIEKLITFKHDRVATSDWQHWVLVEKYSNRHYCAPLCSTTMIITDADLTSPSNQPRPFVISSVPPAANPDPLPLVGAHLRTTWRGDAIIPDYPDNVPCSVSADLTKCKGCSWEALLAPAARPCRWVSPGLRHGTDQFYLLCQRQRDTYRDRSGTKHPMDMFAQYETYGHCPPALFDLYMRSPVNYISYKQPYVIPMSTGRSLRIPDKPQRALVRRHDDGVDVKRKRWHQMYLMKKCNQLPMYSEPQKSWPQLPCISYRRKGHDFCGPLYTVKTKPSFWGMLHLF